MPRFEGFREGKTTLTPIPAKFFSELMVQVDHLGELKLLLYIFWHLNRSEGKFRYLSMQDFTEDELLLSAMGDTQEDALSYLEESLSRTVERGVLLEVKLEMDGKDVSIYFLNSPKGRAAVQAISRGEWVPSGEPGKPVELAIEPANIFRLYEEHIGPLSPMIAEALGEAEDTYPDQWIEDAFRIAVENNKRSWRYVAAILDRWQQEGRDERKDRRDTEKARQRYADWED